MGGTSLEQSKGSGGGGSCTVCILYTHIPTLYHYSCCPLDPTGVNLSSVFFQKFSICEAEPVVTWRTLSKTTNVVGTISHNRARLPLTRKHAR